MVIRILVFMIISSILFTGSTYLTHGRDLIIDVDTVVLVQGSENISYLAILIAKDKRFKEELQVGDCLLLYEKNLDHEIYTFLAEYPMAQVNPWMVSLGEMDGDEKLDIFIGAYRATEFYPEAKRPFIFTWNGEYLEKKWTGSYLNHKDFLSAEFQDMNNDGKDELVVLEGEKDRGYAYGAYIYDHHTLYPIVVKGTKK